MFRIIILSIVFSSICICSESVNNAKPQLKIIGGYTVWNRSDFPYQVSLRLKGYHFCGGAILDHSFILTAAHCCFDNENKPLPIKNLRVVAGDLNIRYRSNFTVIRGVTKLNVHPRYHAEQIQNDLALWELSSPLLWSKYVQPVDIADRAVLANSLCNVTGWGVTNYETNKMGGSLQYVQVPVRSLTFCRRIYPEIDSINAICAGVPGRDSCQGDSGGALVCNKSLTGIVSYGIKCGIYPGIYTDVYAYRSWIRSNMHSSSPSKYSITSALLLSLNILVKYTF